MIQGSPFHVSTPYHALRPVLLDLLGGGDAAAERLAELLPEAPQRQELVKKILGVSADTPQQSPSKPDAARDALVAVLSLLFQRDPDAAGRR